MKQENDQNTASTPSVSPADVCFLPVSKGNNSAIILKKTTSHVQFSGFQGYNADGTIHL
jgi:hypothetical protein